MLTQRDYLKEGQRIYTVSELTAQIKLILENNLSAIWLEGEISNFTHHLSGHMYFSLKDENAVIAACLFRNVNQDMKFKLQDGMKVVCFGHITVYGKRGQYQLIIERIEPKGIGALQLAFEQLKGRLFKEGLFDQAHKKPLPLLPFCVGIVTSATGAAIRDIIKILNQEAKFLRIIVRPTIVQGEEAGEDIALAIAEFNRYPEVDVLIVGRGGGSLEDLWPFNEERVARAIFTSKVPIISAVGHEIDYTIADFVADVRSETPSAAAKLIVNKKNEIINKLTQDITRLNTLLYQMLNNLEQRLNILIASPAFKYPLQRIEELQQAVDDLTRSIFLATGHIIQITEGRFKAILGRFETLNPIAILGRGFSLTTTLSGEIIKEASSLKKGERVNTRLSRGSFQSEVLEVNPNV